MEHSINIMVNRITDILKDNKPSICLFGSVVLNDFKLGWSDIDIICFTEKVISNEQANELVNLRQTLMSEQEGNPYYRLFEGGLLTLNAFINSYEDTVVYWGTSGQRITNKHGLDPFAKIELLENGRLLYGDSFSHLISYPSKNEIVEAVQSHYGTIRKYAKETGESSRSGGWLLDIARCLYTLKTMKVIAKTKAGEWAIREKLSPDIDVLKRVLEIRNNPLLYQNDRDTMKWGGTLGPYIQRFADVLEIQLRTV